MRSVYYYLPISLSLTCIVLQQVQTQKIYNLKRVHFWYDWGTVTDQGQESYGSIIQGIVLYLKGC
jgi:hypothetical protein